KPMTVDERKCQDIIDAVKRTGRKVRVTFNYRYAPHHTKARELIASGVIGQVHSVHFEWLLNTRHGADYFRRWHRDAANSGGLLVQNADIQDFDEKDLKIVTKRAPSAGEMQALLFGWKVVKHVKSNAIVLAKDLATVGIGAGQVNRIWPTEQSIAHAGEKAKGSVLASDAFFPFSDVVEAAADAGITAIIQPGGSLKDEDSIKAADKYGIAMVFTGVRHFRH
ncbi:MAG: hypothetical protein K6U74_11615, partial [Firmicutes bacterium]|nr:hypothetical protein [Bacillota bacterium]